MEFFLFKELLLILLFSIFVLLVGYRLGIPPIVGFILTGIFAGPHGLGLIEKMDHVESIAQLGVILLLFGIGMEFSLKKLGEIRRQFLLGGSLQVGLTILASIAIGRFLQRSWEEAIFLGFLLSMSSTAIVLGILEHEGETESPHGKISIAILIFQDMIAIPMLLLIPLLGNKGGSETGQHLFLLWPVLKGIFILSMVFFLARFIVPHLLLSVSRTRNKELFLVSVLTLCFSVAWLSSSLGLSLTVGAFLAGLIVSESDYRNEAFNHIFPFQALFISFFFISVGMLLDLKFIFSEPGIILFLSLCLLFLKMSTGILTTFLLGLPIRVAVLVGIALSQAGEFSFVLAKVGISHGLGSDYYYQLFLTSSVCTLLISPILIHFSPQIAAWISLLPLPQKWKTGFNKEEMGNQQELQNHVIIIGFGLSGQTVSMACKSAGVPYIILEMNPDIVRLQKKLGEPIHFGDATHLSVLKYLHFHQAKAVVVLINDPIATQNIIKVARKINPTIFIIVRARYAREVAPMKQLGADEVVPDELGTSIEVFVRLLRQYHVPEDEVNTFIAKIRAHVNEYYIAQQALKTKLSDVKLDLSQVEIISSRIHSNSTLLGKSLSQAQLRNLHGLSVLFIRRGTEILSNPSADTQLKENDILVMVRDQQSPLVDRELFGQSVLGEG